MSLLEEYKVSLKMPEVEEILDLIFYRPIAFVFVKLIYRLPVTPNQVTFLSLLAGLTSAWYMLPGTRAGFLFAGIWYGVANILDCGDGMLARLQKSGTPFGRLVDGVVDWAISVAIFVGLGVGLSSASGNPSIWWLVAAGGFTSALHAVIFDYYQQEYISNVRGTRNFLSQEVVKARTELDRLAAAEAGWWSRIWLKVYLGYLGLQESSQFKAEGERQAPPELFRQHNYRVMQWWTLLGATTNRSGLIIASILGRPDIFCWIVAIPGNLFLVFMLFWQRRVQQRLELDLRLQTVDGGSSKG
jgi:phosphatidylglycerophosphate synthase